MSLLDLAWRSIAQSGFRSSVVFLFALLVSGFALSTTLVLRGGEESLRLSRERLGADIMVVPAGTEGRVEGALISGKPTAVWMPADSVRMIAAIPGVEVASPQLFLASLANASCCSASELFMIAIDPRTDFTIQPWLETHLPRGLSLGEGIGGHFVFVPVGDDYIKLYGYFVTLKGNLEPTGSGLDQTLFFDWETAQDMARISRTRAEKPLEIPQNAVSAAMVRVKPGVDPHKVALDIRQSVPGVTPVESPNMFLAVREQLAALRRAVIAVLGLTLALALVLVGLVFSIAVGERRREIGVLRALGATRRWVLRSILGEALILAASGGLVGVAFFALATYLFHDLIVVVLGVPFLLPPVGSFLGLVGAGLALALVAVTLATLGPALRASFQEPALAMRE